MAFPILDLCKNSRSSLEVILFLFHSSTYSVHTFSLFVKQPWLWIIVRKYLSQITDRVPIEPLDGLCLAGIDFWKNRSGQGCDYPEEIHFVSQLISMLYQVSNFS
jgi:hypothetical protein